MRLVFPMLDANQRRGTENTVEVPHVNHGQHRAKVRDVGGFEMLTKERTIELLRDDRLTWAD